MLLRDFHLGAPPASLVPYAAASFDHPGGQLCMEDIHFYLPLFCPLHSHACSGNERVKQIFLLRAFLWAQPGGLRFLLTTLTHAFKAELPLEPFASSPSASSSASWVRVLTQDGCGKSQRG